MKKLIYCLVCLALCATSAVYGKNVITKKRYGSRTVYIRQIRTGGDIDGIPLKGQELEKAAIRFFEIMDKVPLKLISASGLRQVGFYKNLKLNNAPAGGIASGNIMYLAENFSAHTFYHELFHVFDKVSRSTRWNKLNHKDFVYTGSAFESRNTSGRKAKKKMKNLAEKRFDDDFVSRYAMSEEKEDRAETFAAMMVEGAKFMERAKKSDVIKKKMQYIIEATGNSRVLGKDFWPLHLGIDTKEYFR